MNSAKHDDMPITYADCAASRRACSRTMTWIIGICLPVIVAMLAWNVQVILSFTERVERNSGRIELNTARVRSLSEALHDDRERLEPRMVRIETKLDKLIERGSGASLPTPTLDYLAHTEN